MCLTDHIRESFDVSWNAICQLQALVDGDWGELDGTALLPETRQMVEKWVNTIWNVRFVPCAC